ncbi:MAG: hypothetical protein ACR9NN_02130 [Nostochopsis sp.]
MMNAKCDRSSFPQCDRLICEFFCKAIAPPSLQCDRSHLLTVRSPNFRYFPQVPYLYHTDDTYPVETLLQRKGKSSASLSEEDILSGFVLNIDMIW